MLKAIVILFFIFCLFHLHFGEELNYEDVTPLVRNCSGFQRPDEYHNFRCIRILAPEKDVIGYSLVGSTCALNRTLEDDNLVINVCECKPSCSRYNTCCLDSPNNLLVLGNVTMSWQNTTEYSCEYIKHTMDLGPIYIKKACKRSGRYDEAIISLCEDETDSLEDPMVVLPVTNPTTATTYKNHFCAICNDDDINDLVFWNIEIKRQFKFYFEYSFTREYDDSKIFENLVYDNNTGKWGYMGDLFPKSPLPYGVTEDSNNSNKVFKRVNLFFEYPSHIKNSITSCVPDLISDCDPNWKDNAIRNKCHSYMSMIYVIVNEGNPVSRRFRNIHCAICNFAGNELLMSHLSPNIQHPMSRPALRAMSLSWLMDVNPRDGDRVGEIKGCKAGDVFDRFFKKCRTMTCIKPGYIVKNGKCVPT